MKQGDHIEALDILNDSYLGEIVDANDPDFRGRCRIRVFGVFGEKEEANNKIPVEDLPWAYPLYDNSFAGKSGGSGRFSTPKKGTIVRVIFERDIYHPRYVSIEELDTQLREVLKDDYDGFHSLLFDVDEKIKIYHSKKGGLLIDMDGSKIQMKKDHSIVIDHNGSSATIELKGNDCDIVTNSNVNISAPNQVRVNSARIHENGDQVDIGANPIFSAVNGEPIMALLKVMATAIDAKLNATPGVISGVVDAMRGQVLSTTVKTTG